MEAKSSQLQKGQISHEGQSVSMSLVPMSRYAEGIMGLRVQNWMGRMRRSKAR